MASLPHPIAVHPLKAARLRQPAPAGASVLTIREAATRHGVSHVAWAAWEKWPDERGHRMPRHDEMEAICAAYGLSPHMFYLSYRDKLQAGE